MSYKRKETVRKTPPMPEPVHIPIEGNGIIDLQVDPLCDYARWWCNYVHLPILEKDLNEGKKIAFYMALELIAEHQVAPPTWLSSAMLKAFREKARPKNKSGNVYEPITPLRAKETNYLYRLLKAEKLVKIEAEMFIVSEHKKLGNFKVAKSRKDILNKKYEFTLEALADEIGISSATLKKLLKMERERLNKEIDLLP